jgi:hypothetical protein
VDQSVGAARCVDTWLMKQESLLPKERIEAFAY